MKHLPVVNDAVYQQLATTLVDHLNRPTRSVSATRKVGNGVDVAESLQAEAEASNPGRRPCHLCGEGEPDRRGAAEPLGVERTIIAGDPCDACRDRTLAPVTLPCVAVEKADVANAEGPDIRHASCPDRESLLAPLDYDLAEPSQLAATLIRACCLPCPQADSAPHLGYLGRRLRVERCDARKPDERSERQSVTQ